jgi:hypothetical protein
MKKSQKNKFISIMSQVLIVIFVFNGIFWGYPDVLYQATIQDDLDWEIYSSVPNATCTEIRFILMVDVFSKSPVHMVYGTECGIPVNLEINPSYQYFQFENCPIGGWPVDVSPGKSVETLSLSIFMENISLTVPPDANYTFYAQIHRGRSGVVIYSSLPKTFEIKAGQVESITFQQANNPIWLWGQFYGISGLLGAGLIWQIIPRKSKNEKLK